MKMLQVWMRVVGTIYLFVAGVSLPFGTGPGGTLPGIPFEQQYAQRTEDYLFLGGLSFGVIGAALLFGSKDPRQNVIVVWMVIFYEVTRGLLGDAYLLGRGGPVYTYGTLLLTHLAILVTGIIAARRARIEP